MSNILESTQSELAGSSLGNEIRSPTSSRPFYPEETIDRGEGSSKSVPAYPTPDTSEMGTNHIPKDIKFVETFVVKDSKGLTKPSVAGMDKHGNLHFNMEVLNSFMNSGVELPGILNPPALVAATQSPTLLPQLTYDPNTIQTCDSPYFKKMLDHGYANNLLELILQTLEAEEQTDLVRRTITEIENYIVDRLYSEQFGLESSAHRNWPRIGYEEDESYLDMGSDSGRIKGKGKEKED